ncbi:MAG: hypothetical protein K0R57_4096 [Paenibacillaceae bacterium]|jgi:hypothetical protein|nr:hypothetical protein [Paenibacillaceae bacterium]
MFEGNMLRPAHVVRILAMAIAVFIIQLCFTWEAKAEDDYDVGMFYFSSWNPELNPTGLKKFEQTYGRIGDYWSGVKDHLTQPGLWGYGPIPYREPLAGWYDDRQQSVVDQQILQAASRGIDHFAFYYYWKEVGGGERPGQQSIHHFTESPYKDLMSFYIYFVPDGKWPAANWNSLIVPKFVEFMQDPSYKKTPDGRPIVGFYTNMLYQLGSEAQITTALQQLRTAAQNAGLPNPLLLVNGYRTLQSQTDLGFDGFLPLNLAGIGLDSNQNVPADYAISYPPAWNNFVYASYPPESGYENYENYLFIPGGLSAFDPRPWGKGYEKYVYADPSPLKFRAQLENIKAYLDSHPASMNMSTLYAWNENAEGGVIEPTTMDGFGYLNAIQETFGLSNEAYKQKVQQAGLTDLDPGLRLEFSPEYAVATAGQVVKIKGQVTNQFPAPIATGSVTLNTYGWSMISSSGTVLDGLDPGESQPVEFQVQVGNDADWTRHELAAAGSAAVAGQTVSGAVYTFVVKAPDVYGVTEPPQTTVIPGSSVDLQVNIRNYSLLPHSGQFHLSLPSGWVITNQGEGDFSLSGYTGGVHTNRKVSKTFKLAVPSDTPDGSYPILTQVTSGGVTTTSTATVVVGNYLANGSFETDTNGDGLADSWYKMSTTEQLSLSADAVHGLRSQKIKFTGYGGGIGQEWFTVEPNKTYMLEAWVKVEQGVLRVSEDEADAQYAFLGTNAYQDVTGNTWKKISIPYTPKPNAARMSIRLRAWSSIPTIAYVDQVRLYSVPSVPVSGVTLDQGAHTLQAEGTVNLTAAVAPGNAIDKTVTFVSSDPSVAAVTGEVYHPANGTTTATVEAKGAGTATITAISLDGLKTATCIITVE